MLNKCAYWIPDLPQQSLKPPVWAVYSPWSSAFSKAERLITLWCSRLRAFSPNVTSHSLLLPIMPRVHTQVSINQLCGWYRHGLSTHLLLLLLLLVQSLLIPRLPSCLPPHFFLQCFRPSHHHVWLPLRSSCTRHKAAADDLAQC